MDKTFAEKVYKALSLIPKGKVTTYREIGSFLGTRAYRAVGNACGKNPNAPKVPCHRVVRSSGEIGGYAFGAAKKISILKNEGVSTQNGRVLDFKDKLFHFKKTRVKRSASAR